MLRKGYYSHPSIHGDTIAFASDDDVWSVSVDGGLARRLTDSRGLATRPRFSPDGSHIAYMGVEEGYPEIYIMPAQGGQGRRLTRLAAHTLLLGWTPDGNNIIFSTQRGRHNHRLLFVFTVPVTGGQPESLEVGPAIALCYGPEGARVICRGSGLDPAWWKRYRGGRSGELWIDPAGDDSFVKLIETGGNLASPAWLNERIYFHSDHEGIGNIYSCLPSGVDLKRHTANQDYYIRMISGDNNRLVYTAGADIYHLAPDRGESKKVEIDFPSQRSKRARRFVSAEKFLEDYDINPAGHSLCLTTRGKVFTMAFWEAAAKQFGITTGHTRYRLARWLNDGQRIIAISDEGGDESLEIYDLDGGKLKRLDNFDLGRALSLQVSPRSDEVILSNHKGELIHINLETSTFKVIDRSRFGRIAGFDISPDGRYVAYSLWKSPKTTVIMISCLETGEKWLAAEPVLRDVSPCFDPDGNYLYYLSFSGFDPVRDVLDFAYGFPRGVQLKLVTLRKEVMSPFIPQPKTLEKETNSHGNNIEKGDAAAEVHQLKIDFDGLERRIVLFPIPVGNYDDIIGLPGGKVIFSELPVEGLKGKSWLDTEPEANVTLKLFDFDKGDCETLVSNISDFKINRSEKILAYRTGYRLRIIRAVRNRKEIDDDLPSRQSGWIDLTRPKISVDFLPEWQQMFAEGWRLLRDHYYIQDMGGCDWEKVYRRYAPLVERISTRRELSDLFWEMGGELGTSHAYELGGDYPPIPRYKHGFLGADLALIDGKWLFTKIIQGDPGEPNLDSPLNTPGINIKAGDLILAINGIPVTTALSPDELLVNQGGQKVALTVSDGQKSRTVTVKTLRDEIPCRHREWVRKNRERVHQETTGRVGYVHVSDMGPQGFSEFHRAFLSEVERQALIVDVRYNSGGHVSPLILQRLIRKRTGYGISRWIEPYPRPPDSFIGPIIGLTDEFSGSDGDLFSHNFKQLRIGPLVGKRTWGGVVGLNPTHPLVDGTVTTQPEFFNWLLDVGYDLENRGAEPDIMVEVKPQEYARGQDPQLSTAITVALQELEKNPPRIPDFGPHPDRSLPTLE
ncbi:PDZ domain-containing protein [candidate division CSSED10-310 bacterium]|uniref:Tricorn protease homolog n=1 Tax=candidate division CSSED10-310 bacterium TaxID=2855610 RepID=A0ABV6YRA1_UNCC1